MQIKINKYWHLEATKGIWPSLGYTVSLHHTNCKNRSIDDGWYLPYYRYNELLKCRNYGCKAKLNKEVIDKANFIAESMK